MVALGATVNTSSPRASHMGLRPEGEYEWAVCLSTLVISGDWSTPLLHGGLPARWGMTLVEGRDHCPWEMGALARWTVKEAMARDQGQRLELCYGADGSGDLCRLENINDLVSRVRAGNHGYGGERMATCCAGWREALMLCCVGYVMWLVVVRG